MIERAGQGCAIESALFERISQPYVREGQRTGALRFGEPRIMALAGALGVMVHVVSGFTNKSLRSLVAGLLGADYTANQMTYDLRRLRLHGLIERIPAQTPTSPRSRGSEFGENDPETISAELCVGSTLAGLGRYGEAVAALRRVVQASELVLGEDDPTLASATRWLAAALDSTGEEGEAAPPT